MRLLLEGKDANQLGYEERDLVQPLSFVFSEDVIKVSLQIMFGEVEPGIYNLACAE